MPLLPDFTAMDSDAIVDLIAAATSELAARKITDEEDENKGGIRPTHPHL